MSVCFIKESKEKNRLKLIFKKIEEESIKSNNILILPVKKGGSISKRKIRQLISTINNRSIKGVILSNYLNNNLTLNNELAKNGINVLDGKMLFKMLLNEVLEYVCKTGKTSIDKLRISVLTNNISNVNKQIVKELAEKVRSLNVVTNKPKEFKNTERYLYNEMGIIIKLSHNIDKTSNIIINFDFNQEELDIYNIPYKSVIININGNIKNNSKKFCGINIKDYNIIMPSEYKIQDFEEKLVYESIMIGKEYNQIRKQIKKDRIQIKCLIGEKDIINNKEFAIFP